VDGLGAVGVQSDVSAAAHAAQLERGRVQRGSPAAVAHNLAQRVGSLDQTGAAVQTPCVDHGHERVVAQSRALHPGPPLGRRPQSSRHQLHVVRNRSDETSKRYRHESFSTLLDHDCRLFKRT